MKNTAKKNLIAQRLLKISATILIAFAFIVLLLYGVQTYLIQTDSTERVTTTYTAPYPVKLTAGISAGGGLQYLTDADRTSYFDSLEELGVEWVRFDFAWWDIQQDGPSSYSWSKYDAVVTEAQSRDINVLGMIGYTPDWARPTGCDDDKCAPEDPKTYASFVAEVVQRYKAEGVSHWEIWNEPNNTVFWKPKPNVKDYAALLSLSYAAAKKADPAATIISGGLSPATNTNDNIAPVDFTQALYAEGAGKSFDAFGFHPYCYYNDFNCPVEYEPWSAWSQMNDTPVNIRGIMKAHNDTTKKIWATEFGAPTKGDNSVTEALQASMVNNAYIQFAQNTWAGPLFWYSLKDAGTDETDVEDWFGLLDANGRKKPSFDAYLKTMSLNK